MSNDNKEKNKKEDYYKLLNIDKDATQQQIKSSYKKLAMKLHPDKGGNSEKVLI
jgi:DnaJ-class molecular chaperone